MSYFSKVTLPLDRRADLNLSLSLFEHMAVFLEHSAAFSFNLKELSAALSVGGAHYQPGLTLLRLRALAQGHTVPVTHPLPSRAQRAEAWHGTPQRSP